MKYKTIRSAIHNIADSFVSDANFVPGESVLSVLARRAFAAKTAEVFVDLKTAVGEPSALFDPAISQEISEFVARAATILVAQGLDPSRIPLATLRITFELTRQSESTGFPESSEMPYDCTAVATDDRGVVHQVHFRRWVLFFNEEKSNRQTTSPHGAMK